MSIGNLPENSWFAAPEGVYTLVSTANTTLVQTPNPFANNNAAPQPPTPALHALDQPPPAPPVYPSKLAVVSVRLPVKDNEARATGFGMSMGRRGAAPPGKDDSTSPPTHSVSIGSSSESASEPIPIVGTSQATTTTAGGGSGTSLASSNANLSPATKRRPLTSSFSMLGGLNTFAGGGTDGPGSVSSGTRPARALKGSTSSFLRSWEGLPLSQIQMRAMSEANAGKDTVFGFQTMSKGVFWSEIGKGKKEPLSRIIFSSFPTCINANQHTASHLQIDLLVGFASGDIIWIDPLTAKYTRFNKSGVITSSPVTSISWLPPGPASDASSLPSTPSLSSSLPENRSNLFLTSHADGTILIWDKDREDWNGFVPNTVPRESKHGLNKENEWSDSKVAFGEEAKAVVGSEELIVSKPPLLDKKGQSMAKFNPVSHWRVSKQAIYSFAVSPDLQYCATVGEDGCLRIIDFVEEKLLDSFASYFGSLTCVSWSPDGRFVVTGGQDDLLTVYAPHEQHVVALCPGHTSWVTGVAFDPERTEDRTMRFVSIGEDCKLILWDLSSAALTRPKTHIHSYQRRHSASSQLSLHRRSTSELAPGVALSPAERDGPVFHPPPRRDDCSVLQPIMVKTLSNDLFSGLALLPDFVILGARGGQVSQYDRPPTGDLTGLNNEFAASVIRIDARAR
ncbi:uncharacterized protein JCM15063_001474 [Sporobolomyces koalae]|uniref:uncharacterized protein n=1 Tax=Sporobolomyces koalae TaxID=500713 RepID=UPI00317111CA